jgi:nitrate reductase NapE component
MRTSKVQLRRNQAERGAQRKPTVRKRVGDFIHSVDSHLFPGSLVIMVIAGVGLCLWLLQYLFGNLFKATGNAIGSAGNVVSSLTGGIKDLLTKI